MWTGGNSSSNTLGVGSTLRRTIERSEFRLAGGAIRTESSLTRRMAVGTSADDFVLQEETTTETTAESYYLRGRYDYTINERFFLFGGADWLRNTFAGINSRFLIAAGAGNSWIDNDRWRFRTDYGFTITFQNDVVENPFITTTFPGLRLSYDFRSRLTASTELTSVLITDWNLENTDDLRFDFTNALPIAISSIFTLKPSLRLMWRNDPSLSEVELVAPDGAATGQTVLAPLDKLDSFVTVSLVVEL
ncbi:MAG: DUF481 domain-containing protein [Gemmatimonadota bacterium]